MKKNSIGKRIALAMLLPALFVSCTKSAGLGGASNSTAGTSSNGGLSGTVSGGLSPVSGATVVLYAAGNPPTQLGTATTTSTGTFSISYNAPSSSTLLYVLVTAGTTSSANPVNLKNQFLALAGTGSSPNSSVTVNELTTSGTEQVAFNMGLLSDSNGTVTLNAPKNAAGASNVITQFNNMISSGSLNTSNSNLTTAMKNGLSALANDFASCIENSSNCSTLFTTALSTGSAAAGTVLESGYNALTNSGSISSSMYTFGFPQSSSTGFTLPSSSVPGGFTFNNTLAIAVKTFSVGSSLGIPIAVDGSGNLWVADTNKITQVSPTGVVLGSISTSSPQDIVIDGSGNLWVSNGGANTVTKYTPSGAVVASASVTNNNFIALDPSGNLWVAQSGPNQITEVSSSGTVLTNITAGGNPQAIAFDASGNGWVANFSSSNNVLKINSSGTSLGTFSVGDGTTDIGVDPSGNVWTTNQNANTISKLSSSGSNLGNFTTSTTPYSLAFDNSGNVWVANINFGASPFTVQDFNSSGVLLATYSMTNRMTGIAIDASGNVWAVQRAGANLFELPGVANGPQFFPYSGSIYPY